MKKIITFILLLSPVFISAQQIVGGEGIIHSHPQITKDTVPVMIACQILANIKVINPGQGEETKCIQLLQLRTFWMERELQMQFVSIYSAGTVRESYIPVVIASKYLSDTYGCFQLVEIQK